VATPESLGLEAMVYALERQAAAIGTQSYIDRAAELERRMKSMWVPMMESPFIRSDALDLGLEMGKLTGNYILFDPDEGREVDPGHAAFLSGDVGAGLDAASEDLKASAGEAASAVAAGASSALSGTQKTLIIVAVAAFALFLLAKEI